MQLSLLGLADLSTGTRVVGSENNIQETSWSSVRIVAPLGLIFQVMKYLRTQAVAELKELERLVADYPAIDLADRSGSILQRSADRICKAPGRNRQSAGESASFPIDV